MKKYFLFILLSAVFISCGRKDDSNPVIPPPPSDILISIHNPKFGDYYHPGDEVAIKWSFPERIGSVNILLFRKTEFKGIIAAGIKNSGEFTWKIPEIINRSVHYRIEIRNANDSTFTTLSEYFYIVE